MSDLYKQAHVLVYLFLLFGIGDFRRCSICDTMESGQSCLTNPPALKECQDGYNYCISVAKYLENGQLGAFTRSCSPFTFPETCLPGQDKHTMKTFQVCYTTCSKDGCNGSSSLHHILDLLRRKRK